MKVSDSAGANATGLRGISGRRLPWRGLLAIVASGCLIGVGWASFRAMNHLASAEHLEKHSYEVILKFEQLMSTMKDAETGQRGYLLTGRGDYLAPYFKATREVDKLHKTLLSLTADNPAQQRRLFEIASLTQVRMQVLERIIDLRRTEGFDAAVQVVRLGQSKAIMDAVRQHISEAQAEEERLLAQRTASKVEGARETAWVLSLAGLVGSCLLLGVLLAYYRENTQRQRFAHALQEQQANLEHLVRIRTEELGKSEARLAGIVDSAMDAIISIDASQRIVLFNMAAEQMFQCPAQAALGAPIERFIPVRFRAVHGDHISCFGQTGESRRTMGRLGAVYGLRTNGQEFPIEASISQIKVHDEKLYTVILRDISARIAAEEEIRRMNTELEARVEARTAELREANQELETFAYAVSHDLRAPLRAINGFGNILAQDYGGRLDEAGKQYLDYVVTSAQRMGELIEGLLQLSRSSRGEIVMKPVDLSALARRILEELALTDPGRQVRWDIEEGLAGEGDPRMLEALLRNLLGNAWKYTARVAEARIRFYLDHTTHPPCFCIADNGAGFDMRHAEMLFQPFRRLHGQDEFPGIGIGLATVKRIVQRHGGEIHAEAEPGKGARFYFTLSA